MKTMVGCFNDRFVSPEFRFEARIECQEHLLQNCLDEWLECRPSGDAPYLIASLLNNEHFFMRRPSESSTLPNRIAEKSGTQTWRNNCRPLNVSIKIYEAYQLSGHEVIENLPLLLKVKERILF